MKKIFELNKKTIKKFDNNVTIKNITNKKDFIEFYKVPWNIYVGNPYWIPAIYNESLKFFNFKNPFWNHADTQLFTIKKNKKIVGRIASFIDYQYCKKLNNKLGFFGFFESINDYSIASNLLKTAEDWLKLKGINKIQGPINGRVDMGFGLLIKGFKQAPIFPDIYSQKYYIDLLENYGFKKFKDFYGYYLDIKKPMSKDLKLIADKFKLQNTIKIRQFSRIRSRKDIKWWIKFMINNYNEHWGYVHVEENEVRSRYGISNIRWFVDNKLFLIAEYNKIPIGFSWTFPDYNQIFKKINGKINLLTFLNLYIKRKKINQANMNIIGIDSNFRNTGLGSFINYFTIKELKKRGYSGAQIGITDEKNLASKKIIEKTGAKHNKTFRIYEKSINI
jgi:hypothetical protein